MALKIFWTERATTSFSKVITYLKENWSEKEIKKFIEKTNSTLFMITSGTITFRSSGKKNIFEVLVTKHNLLIYKIKKDQIILLRFFDTRQNPKKKKL